MNNKLYYLISIFCFCWGCKPAQKWTSDGSGLALKTKFEQAEDYAAFIAKHSDSGYDGEIDIFPDKDGLADMADSVAFLARKGAVVGPFAEQKGGFQLVKVVGTYQTKQLKARHILLQMSEVPTEAQEQFADKVIAEIKNGKSFEMAAAQYSNDLTNKNNGGELGWFEPHAMVQPFADAVKAAEKDAIFKIRTMFGMHVVHKQEVLQDRRTGIRVVRLFKKS